MMHDPVGFSVWDSALTIGNRRFSGALLSMLGRMRLSHYALMVSLRGK
jgi:hypothetical protein